MAGNIQKRGESSYRITVSGGYDSSGKQILYRKTVKAKNDKEAEKLLSLYIAEIETGIAAETKNIKLKDFVDIWKKNYAEKHLAPKTIWRYNQLLDLRIIPSLGHLKIDKIRPHHLMTFYNNISEVGVRLDKKENKGLSSRTVLHHHRLLHAILEKAVMWQYLPSNPASRIEAPKVEKKIVGSYDDEQIPALVEVLQKESIRDQIIVLIALGSGARLGEVVGLTWDKVNLTTNEIDIQKAYQYVPGEGKFEKPPKNESSKRKLALPDSLIALLKKWKAEQNEHKLLLGENWIDKTNAVFTSYLSTRLPAETVSRWFNGFIKRHDLPKMTFHGLRHTAASLLIAYGATIPEVSKLLGHSVTSTTLNIYAHAAKNSNKMMADKLDSIINKLPQNN